MKGENVVQLNQAEMIEAMTLYAKTKMFSPEYMANAEIRSVEQEGGGYDKTWTVKLGEVTPKA